MNVRRLLVLVLLMIAACAPHHSLANPTVGVWSANYPLPNIAIHAAVLPNTTKLWMAQAKENPNALGTWAWVWDWSTPTEPAVDASLPWAYDFMCGGNTLLADGRLLLVGGRINANQSALFDPITLTYAAGPEFYHPLYYPAATLNGSGWPYVFLGLYPSTWVWDTPTAPVEDEQYFHKVYGADLAFGTAGESYYPRVFLQPDGTFFMAGVMKQTRSLNPVTKVWTDIAPMSNQRFEGVAFPMPGTDGSTIVTMGGDVTATRNTFEYIDLSVPSPAWVKPPTLMKSNHQAANAVILPDGTVWVGGGRGNKEAELFDPVTKTVTAMAPMSTGRGYHSTALLLPDARVVVAGDNGSTLRKTAEIWSPPYLDVSRGPRPALAIIPGIEQVTYGSSLPLVSVDAATVQRVTMVKASATSHGYNPDQKHHELPFTVVGNKIAAVVPSNPNVAPPGWYMVWALRNGVPSMAVWIRLRGVE